MNLLDLWVHLPYQAYTWESVQAINDQNPVLTAVLLLLVVFGIGLANQLVQTAVAKQEGSASINFWMSAYIFGVDSVFILIFPLYFFEIQYWLWDLYVLINFAFVISELKNLKLFVKYQRQELWGAFYEGEVTERQAWIRGIEGYALGLIGCIALRFLLGDTMGWLLFLSTIAMIFVFQSYGLEKGHTRRGFSWLVCFLGIAVVVTSYLPAPFGFYATVMPEICGWYMPGFAILALINLYGVFRTAYVYYKLPEKESPDGKPLPWWRR